MDCLLPFFRKNPLLNLAKMEGSEVLFTGGSGVVVINLIAQLLLHKVRPQRLVVSYRSSFPGGLESVLASAGIVLIKGDLTKTRLEGTFDYIVHGATYGQPGKYLSEKLLTISLNTTELIRLSEHLKGSGTLLYLSSADVYDGVTSFPIKETDCGLSHPWHTRSAYFESKRCGEAICSAMASSGIRAKAARLALGYGAGFKIDDRRVMYEFTLAALKKKAIHLKDHGRALRTYGHAHDVSEMIFNILLHAQDHYYNIGGTSRLTILDLAHLIASKTGATVHLPQEVSTEEQIRNAPSDVWLDLEKYCKEFSKTTFLPIDQGIDDVIAWAKTILPRD